MKVEVAGENALIVYFSDSCDPDPAISARVHQAVTRAEQALGDWLIDLIPAYASLLVIYDLRKCDHTQVRQRLLSTLDDCQLEDELQGQLIRLPVWYDCESGPDLSSLAKRCNMSIEDVIQLHSAVEYRVYAIGFAPGFAYLGQVDERIAIPRRSTPRQHVPQGAVAIAERQTAVYPAESPGGWTLIGRCPLPMFDPSRTPCMPLEVGDRVRFEPIDRATFFDLGGEL